MLATHVKLHDIADIEGFVCKTIEKSGLRPHLEESEREELIADGICILYELAERYEPHRAGYATSGRFSGYAAQFLPRRLGDTWHAKHPEHRRIADEATGKRRWHYHDKPLSLNEVLAGGARAEAGSTNDGFEISIRPATEWAAVPAR